MKSIDNIMNAILSHFYHLSPWLLRLGLGISFIFHGLGKFPLPPQKLIDYFGFSPELASFVAISELLPTWPFKNPPRINKIPAPSSEIATKLASSGENPK